VIMQVLEAETRDRVPLRRSKALLMLCNMLSAPSNGCSATLPEMGCGVSIGASALLLCEFFGTFSSEGRESGFVQGVPDCGTRELRLQGGQAGSRLAAR